MSTNFWQYPHRWSPLPKQKISVTLNSFFVHIKTKNKSYCARVHVANFTNSEIPDLETREGRCSLLSICDGRELSTLIEHLLDEGTFSSSLRVIRPAYVGSVQYQVREPVCEERFFLTDVIVTVAEVAIGEHLGWAMRVGTDRKTTVAAAIADALLEAGHPEASGTLRTLLSITRHDLADQRRQQWMQLHKTIIEFEELD